MCDAGRVSRDRTAVVPRAVTPRDSTLAAAMAKLRAEHPEWGWATAMADELQAQGKDVARLCEVEEERKGTVRRLKGLVGGSIGSALLALAVALHGWGKKDGLAEAAQAQATEYRARVQVLEERVQDQALDIARLQALSVRPSGTWGLRPSRRTTEPDIDLDHQGDHTP